MSARERTGIRAVESLEGGLVVWLYPGGADLDEVMLEVARWEVDEDVVEWLSMAAHYTEGPNPRPPSDAGEVAAYLARRPPVVWTIDEEHPTSVRGDIEVGYFRRHPWCTCGDDHAWHIEPAVGGRPGAMLAVYVCWDW